jgi:hypothetical protein
MNKKTAMSEVYKPGMTAQQLVAQTASKLGVDVSTSYARQFVSLAETAVDVDGAATVGGNDVDAMVQQLNESVARLEQMLYTGDWRMLSMQAQEEFSPAGIRKIIELARIMKVKNPIIKRGVEILRLYVFAQGVQVKANDERVGDVVTAFMTDTANRDAFTGHQALGEKEESLQSDGNLFLRFFVDGKTGAVAVRTVDALEITEIVTNPNDTAEPWFYHRSFSRVQLDGTTEQVNEYYPDIAFIPSKPSDRARYERELQKRKPGAVRWETPIKHVSVNRFGRGRFGVPEYYAAHDWALAYKSFLEQLAAVWQALARWSWKLTTSGGRQGVAAAKNKLHTTLTSGSSDTNPPPVAGGAFVSSPDVTMQPFRTAGATMAADDGRRLLLMATAVFGWPETFFGDASVGSLATAKSLDRPTELRVRDRQTLWENILRDVVEFVIACNVKAPNGVLTNDVAQFKYERDPVRDDLLRRVVTFADDVDGGVTVQFPPIVETDVPALVDAVIDASTMKGTGGGVPVETAVAQLVDLLGLPDAQQIMELWREERDERERRAQEIAQATANANDNGDGAGGNEPGAPQTQTESAALAILATALDNYVDQLTEGSAA